MSGMEPLAAFGIACNAMQVIHFTFEAVSTCKKVFETGLPDPGLAQFVGDSARLYTNIDQSIQEVRPLTENDSQFLQIVKDTRNVSEQLKDEITKISHTAAKGKLTASVTAGVKAKLREKRVNKLVKRLQEYQRILESGFLDRICKKTDALGLQQDIRFNDLDDSLRNFIRSYSEGQRRLDHLLDTHTTAIKELVRSETIKAQQSLTNAVQSVSAKTSNDVALILKQMSSEPQIWQKRDKLLKSLKYSTMSDRLNQIPQPHDGTYQWVMRGTRLWEEEDEDENTPKTRSEPPPSCVHSNPMFNVCWSCFPCWLESSNASDSLYWIQGKTGAGKSTLMKFIVSDRSLWSGLQLPESDPLIISHFLWAPGGQLQKSLRGLLLSLLYQFLSANEKLLDQVLDAIPGVKFKDVPGDWSLEEMQMIVQTWFPKSGRPIFVFLDGLDEMDTDDRASPDPLKFISTKIARIHNVKVCVSSRPEQQFLRHFANTPSLRLQDITFFDMKMYVQAYLVPDQSEGHGVEDIRKLIEAILVKADGVFLWIALVVRSLVRGLANGDSIEELNMRLEQMPKGLNALYQDMWARLNDDEPIYRQEAALYFNLIRDWRVLRSDSDDGPRHDSDATIGILGLLLAVQQSKAQAILDDPAAFSIKELESACRDITKRIERRTAGLLHVLERHSGRTTYVEFIHRSSLEFLENTPEGQRILSFDKTPPQERLSALCRGFMARTYLGVMGQHHQDLEHQPVDGVLDMISTNFKRGRILQGDVVSLVLATKRLFDMVDHGKDKKFQPAQNFRTLDFVGVLAMFGFHGLLELFTGGLVPGWDQSLVVSPHYTSYLLVAALTRPDLVVGWLHPNNIKGKSQVVATLLGDSVVVDFNPLNGSTSTVEVEVAPGEEEKGTKLVALIALLCSKDFWSSNLPGLPQTVLSYIKDGIPLGEIITVYLEVPPANPETIFLLSPSCLVRRNYYLMVPGVIIGKAWIAIEMNICFLIELVLNAVNSSGQDGLGNKARPDDMGFIKRHARILAFHVPYWGSMGVDRPSHFRKLLSPATLEDSNHVLSCLDDISLASDEPNSFQIPELWKRIEEIAPRANDADEEGFQRALRGPVDEMVERLMDPTRLARKTA